MRRVFGFDRYKSNGATRSSVKSKQALLIFSKKYQYTIVGETQKLTQRWRGKTRQTQLFTLTPERWSRALSLLGGRSSYGKQLWVVSEQLRAAKR